MLKFYRSNLLLLLITCLSGFSCNDRISGSNGSSSKNVPNRDFAKDFVRLKKEFDKDGNGKIDPMKKIALSLMKSILKDDFDSSCNTYINPVAQIVNDAGYFFIIRENCIAGADCDASGITSFKYKIMADTAIMTYESNYDLSKGRVTDSATKHNTLTLPNCST